MNSTGKFHTEIESLFFFDFKLFGAAQHREQS